MPERVDAEQADEMVRNGARLLDALPASIYQQEHLPGAVSLPLESFDPDATREQLRSDEPLITYCFDQRCDLSSRLANRLEQTGFTNVHDLIGGRAAWTVLGKPTEGQVGDRRRIAQFVVDTPAVPIGSTIADARAVAKGTDPVAVLGEGSVLLGALHPSAMQLSDDTSVEGAMITAPGTIRPDERVEDVVQQLRKDHLDHVYVSTVSGVLVGLVKLDDLHV